MNLIPIGYFSKTHGLKGHIVLKISTPINIAKLKTLFIETNGSQAPYFIEEMSKFKEDYIVKLETIDNVDLAAKLKNSEVCVEEKFIVEEIDFEFLGFTLVDKQKGEVGVIAELIDTPGNPLLRIERRDIRDLRDKRDGRDSGDKEILIPFNIDFIVKVIKDKKQLIYNIPDGLLEIYL